MKRIPPKIEPDPVIEAYKKDVDRTLIAGNLRKTAGGIAAHSALMIISRLFLALG